MPTKMASNSTTPQTTTTKPSPLHNNRLNNVVEEEVEAAEEEVTETEVMDLATTAGVSIRSDDWAHREKRTMRTPTRN
jgi:hypothetical protein